MDIVIAEMNLSDLENIKDNLKTEFDEFWNFNILKQEFESDNSYLIIAKSEGEIVGFAGIKIILDEADLMNIVVKKDKRHSGIGSLLLENLISYSTQKHLLTITLEVNENNKPAIDLYAKFNFKETGIRKNYYDGKYDALIMTKTL